MGKIVLNMEGFSTEADINDAIAKINASLPNDKAAQKANVVKDANGKVFKVEVGLPGDATAQEHLDARDAALANPGVATAPISPVGGACENFDALTSGAVITSLNLGTAPLVVTWPMTPNPHPGSGNPTGEWRVSPDNEGVGGTGKGLILTDIHLAGDGSAPSVQHILSAQTDYLGSVDGYTQINAFEIKVMVKAKEAGKNLGDTLHSHGHTINFGDNTLRVFRTNALDWALLASAGRKNNAFATIPFVENQYEQLILRLNVGGLLLDWQFGSASGTLTRTFAAPQTTLSYSVISQDLFTTDGNKNQVEPTIDDLCVTLLDAV